MILSTREELIYELYPWTSFAGIKTEIFEDRGMGFEQHKLRIFAGHEDDNIELTDNQTLEELDIGEASIICLEFVEGEEPEVKQ